MAIETLDDIIDNICDVIGIYGAHDDELECDESKKCGDKLREMCRVCATSSLRTRIEAAVDVELRLGHTARPVESWASEEKATTQDGIQELPVGLVPTEWATKWRSVVDTLLTISGLPPMCADESLIALRAELDRPAALHAEIARLTTLGAQQVCEIDRLTAELAIANAYVEELKDLVEQAKEDGRKSASYLNNQIREEKQRWCDVVRELARERGLVRWRDVKQELPGVGGWYEGCWGTYIVRVPIEEPYGVVIPATWNGMWRNDNGYELKVTHWMPMPEPPASSETKPLAPEPVDSTEEE